MNAETFEKLPPDVHRLIKNIFIGEDVTEVQINFVLKQHDIDRSTFDDAVDHIRKLDRGIRSSTFLAVLLLFAAMQLLIYAITVLFR